MGNIYLIFNGDADGICATHQLRLSGISSKKLITGVKRDISLLKKIKELKDEQLYVLDIAVEKNLKELNILLSKGCSVIWFDHHVSPEIPIHKNFSNHIDIDPNTNTSLLVSQFLSHKFALWAVVGLFGDNLHLIAERLATELGISKSEQEQLMELGELFNYNGYGGSLNDLHIHPADLLEQIAPYQNPFQFLKDSHLCNQLKIGREEDLNAAGQALQLAPNVIKFPNQKWARRVIGIYANRLVQEKPDQAHAVLVANGEGGSTVSVRSPLIGTQSSAEFCQKFPTGGGRIKAAGINNLKDSDIPKFIKKFNLFFDPLCQ
jgi:single-stranded DNA-specific DHH superfamily exonuclease